MSQSKSASLVEALSSTAIGFALSYIAGLFIFPLFGLSVSAAQNFWITVAFTVISIARGYVLRRLFNHFSSRP